MVGAPRAAQSRHQRLGARRRAACLRCSVLFVRLDLPPLQERKVLSRGDGSAESADRQLSALLRLCARAPGRVRRQGGPLRGRITRRPRLQLPQAPRANRRALRRLAPAVPCGADAAGNAQADPPLLPWTFADELVAQGQQASACGAAPPSARRARRADGGGLESRRCAIRAARRIPPKDAQFDLLLGAEGGHSVIEACL
mmetsp:Transcript_26724/g.58662  ORF Transcript_26724/g.58662 Transcript_26724/m.58662 type:complete len:200 (-) Transcript_26724:589-1188(-)